LPGGADGHLLQVALAHEADEDALGLVIPGNAGDHGCLEVGIGIGVSGFGSGGELVRLGLFGLVSWLGLVSLLGLIRCVGLLRYLGLVG